MDWQTALAVDQWVRCEHTLGEYSGVGLGSGPGFFGASEGFWNLFDRIDVIGNLSPRRGCSTVHLSLLPCRKRYQHRTLLEVWSIKPFEADLALRRVCSRHVVAVNVSWMPRMLHSFKDRYSIC